jgi:acyl-CoA thioester hydrolase
VAGGAIAATDGGALDVAVPSVSPVLTPVRSTSPSSFAKLRIDGEEFVCVVAFVTIGPYIRSIMTTLSHLFPIKILPEDIDFMGHVNNSRYLNWVQEAVLEHWRNLAPPDAVAARAWVALKHEITYRKPAFLEDDVVANVVLEKIHGARAFYDTVIKRGEEVLAEVKSSWCCIDVDTLRPARISADVSAYFFPKAD